MLVLLEEHIISGNLEALDQLLSQSPHLLQQKTNQKYSPLLLACHLKKPEVVDTILKHQPELNVFEACAAGKFDWLVHRATQFPDQLAHYTEYGYTALGLAVQFGHEELVRYLLIKDVDVNMPMKDGTGNYPIHLAILHHQEMIAKMLIEAGSLVNLQDQDGLSPLHLAARNGDIELIIQLLEAGADVKQISNDGKTAGDWAEAYGWNDIARILND